MVEGKNSSPLCNSAAPPVIKAQGVIWAGSAANAVVDAVCFAHQRHARLTTGTVWRCVPMEVMMSRKD